MCQIGGDTWLDTNESVAELGHVAMDLLITVNLMATVMGRYPEEVQENFDEKIGMLTGNLIREMEEFNGFAEALDDTID